MAEKSINNVEIWRLDLADAAWEQDPPQRRYRAVVQSQRAWRGVRHLLARQLDAPAELLHFERSESGKPRLVDGAVEFNIAHSGDVALIALSTALVGVDLEHALPIEVELEGLAQSVLHADEFAAWQALPQAWRLSTFYRAWVRKEAYLKLTGTGLQQRMTDLAIVGQDPDGLAILNMATGEERPNGHLRDVEVASGFNASVCSMHSLTSVLVHTLPARELTRDTADA